jgi:hypothetical protein
MHSLEGMSTVLVGLLDPHVDPLPPAELLAVFNLTVSLDATIGIARPSTTPKRQPKSGE